MTVRDTDKGYKALIQRMHALAKGATVRAGIHAVDGQHSHGGKLTVLDVATFHEFGTSKVPMRSFVRGWMTLHERDVHDLYTDQLRLYIAGTVTPLQFLHRMGLYMTGGMKQRISQHIPPPLAPVTIRRKGSSTPLIDTGQLRASITYSFKWANSESKYVPSEAQGVYKEASKAMKKAEAKAARAVRNAQAKAARAGNRAKTKASKAASRARSKAVKRFVKGGKKTVTKAGKSVFRGLRKLYRKATR